MRKYIAISALALASVGLTACDDLPGKEDYKTDRGRGDAPVGEVNGEPADVLEFPDLYPNVAVKCDAQHGNLVYVPVYKDGRPGTPVVVEGGCAR